jgi:hypothetical protein
LFGRLAIADAAGSLRNAGHPTAAIGCAKGSTKMADLPAFPLKPDILLTTQFKTFPGVFLPPATLHPYPIRAKARPANDSPAFTLV